MLLGLSLFWVGAVLFLNGLWVLDKVGDREIAVIDVFVGTLTLIVAIYLAFGPGANADSIKGAAFLLLFTFTYYWVAWNRWNGADGRGLGWFCLFVAITCAPISLQSFATRTHAMGLLACVLMALLGCPLVSFLLAACGRKKRADKIYWWSVHTPGHLHRVDSWLSAAHRRHAWRTGTAALTKVPRTPGPRPIP